MHLCHYAKFLYRVARRPQHAAERIAFVLIVIIQAVQRNVALVGARAIHRAAAAVGILLGARLIAEKDHARLQAEQIEHVIALERESLDLRWCRRAFQWWRLRY